MLHFRHSFIKKFFFKNKKNRFFEKKKGLFEQKMRKKSIFKNFFLNGPEWFGNRLGGVNIRNEVVYVFEQ